MYLDLSLPYKIQFLYESVKEENFFSILSTLIVISINFWIYSSKYVEKVSWFVILSVFQNMEKFILCLASCAAILFYAQSIIRHKNKKNLL